MIIDANSRPFAQQSLSVPNMDAALDNWMQPISIKIVTKEVQNFVLMETFTDVDIMAIRQPMGERELRVKPEGQRAWNWEILHTRLMDNFDLDTVVIFNNTRYRIMYKTEWAQYGYIEYHIVQDFEPAIKTTTLSDSVNVLDVESGNK